MRILHLIDSAGLYGAEKMILALASQQQRTGSQPVIGVIMTSSDPVKVLETEAVRIGLPVKRIVMAGGARLSAFLEIGPAIDRLQPDIVHAHGYKAIILAGYLGLRGHPTPVVATAHGYTAKGRRTRVALFEALDRRALRSVAAIAAVSGVLGSLLVESGVPKKLLRTIPNGIPLQVPGSTPPTKEELDLVGFCEHAPTVIGIGRLSLEKNFPLLIRAVARVRKKVGDCQLLILGEGKQRAALQALAIEQGLSDHIRMPGFLRSDLLLRKAAVLAISSLSEGLPLVLLEAMRDRVPVVAAAVGGIPEALGAPSVGRLVDVGDEAGLATALIEVLVDRKAAADQVERAYLRFALEFTDVTMAAAYDEMYRAVCGAKSTVAYGS